MSDADCTPGREPRSVAASSIFAIISTYIETNYTNCNKYFRQSRYKCVPTRPIGSEFSNIQVYVAFFIWNCKDKNLWVYDIRSRLCKT